MRHMLDGRTIYWDDAAPPGCWPFSGCFGPYFPESVRVGQQIFHRYTYSLHRVPQGKELREVYRSEDRSLFLYVYRDCTYTVQP